jgi:hypothetical protein
LKNRLLVIGILLSSFLSAVSQQGDPTDRHNSAVLVPQDSTTHYFLRALENLQIDRAHALVDPVWAKSKGAFKDSLKKYAAELAKYKGTTQLSVVIVWPDLAFNTFRCRYYNSNGIFFFIDLYFSVGQPASMVRRIDVVPPRELKRQRAAEAVLKKKPSDNAVPPPEQP